MKVEVVLEYPRTLYRVPGSLSGSGFLPGYTYDPLLVGSDEEAEEAIKEGFFLTPGEAKEAFDAKGDVPVTDAPAVKRGRPPKEA